MPLHVALAEGGKLRNCVGEGVPPPVQVLVRARVPEGLADSAVLVVGEGVGGGVPNAVAEVPPVGERDVVQEPLSVEVGVPEGVPEAVPVVVPVGELLPVPLLLSDSLPVLLADAPEVSEGVGEALVVVLPLSVEEGVAEGVHVAEPVAVCVSEGVPLWLWLVVLLGDGEVLAVEVAEELAPCA